MFGNMPQPSFVELLLYIWIIAWKGLALWRAGRNDQKYWFLGILLFPINTFGILEIVYLFFFATKKLRLEEIKNWRHLLLRTRSK